MKKFNKISLFLTSIFLTPSLVLAENVSVGMIDYSGQKLVTIITKITQYILGFAAALAVLFIIWSGFQYVTAAGNKDRIEAAKKTLTYAIFGLIVIILAYAIVSFVNINVKDAIS